MIDTIPLYQPEARGVEIRESFGVEHLLSALTLMGSRDNDMTTVSVPIIDTHQHLWDLKKVRLAWLNLEGKEDTVGFDRSFLMEEYLQAIESQNVVASVYMEVNVMEEGQQREVEYVLDLCRSHSNPLRAAVIGGYPDSPRFASYIESLAGDDFIKGVRTVLHDPDRPPAMCLSQEFIRGCRLLGELDLSFDLCMRPGELLDAVRLVDSCPQTRFILDHCGNLPVTSTDMELRRLWEEGICELAKREAVTCKISGIVATARSDWQSGDLADVVSFCLDGFGEDRVCFGGDWPVCTLKASYSQWVDALKWIVRNRSPQFKRKLFHDNALRIYRLQS